MNETLSKIAKRLALMLAVLSCFCVLGLKDAIAADHGIAGRWRGTWTSQTTGHHGPLNARFRSQGDGSVRAIFTGRFAVVVPFRYTMNLQPSLGSDGTVWLSGSKKLGPVMGSYDFSARSDGCTFNAAYSAGKDNGNFYLRRTQ